MHKVEFLEKHCTTSKDGVIALGNTLVETAIRVHNCPIKVTCADYPGQVAVYSVNDLLVPVGNPGPYQNKNGEGTYSIYLYPWKGVNVETSVETSEENTEVDNEVYTITQMVPVPTPTQVPVTINQYMGHVIMTQRTALGLTDREVVEKIRLKEKSFSINTYKDIEKGKDTNSKLKTYQNIARALNLHISDLFPSKN